MRRIAACALLSLMVPVAASADPFIVDTGTPEGSHLGFNRLIYYAGQFSISDNYVIQNVEGYLGHTFGPAGAVTVGIHADGGEVPGTLLASSSFNLSAGAPLAWYGVTGLNALLSAGTYWASFVPSAASRFSGVMPADAPNPLTEYAFGGTTIDGKTGWITPVPPPSDPHLFDKIFDVGIRISADPVDSAPVPEPASMLLLATGLAVVGARHWRRRA